MGEAAKSPWKMSDLGAGKIDRMWMGGRDMRGRLGVGGESELELGASCISATASPVILFLRLFFCLTQETELLLLTSLVPGPTQVLLSSVGEGDTIMPFGTTVLPPLLGPRCC